MAAEQTQAISDNENDLSTLQTENHRLLNELESIYTQYLLLKDETDISYAQLRERNQTLETKVLELEKANLELEEAENQLIHSERMAAMGQLAASIVHELSNPLTVISGYIELLLLRPSISGEDARLLNIARQHSVTMTSLVRDILSFSHKQASPFGIINVNTIIEYVVPFLDALMKKRTLSITRTLGRDLPLTMGSTQQIQQIFINLITNASDAMEGKGSLTIVTDCMDTSSVQKMFDGDDVQSARSAADMQALCEAYPQFLATHFIDNGPGIPTETLKNIFNPFFTTKPAGKGTGLGLSISRTIIERHDGNIMVSSREGEGTTFTVLLPVRSARDAASSMEQKN